MELLGTKSTRHGGAHFYWDYKTLYFYKGTVCKEFQDYDSAWDWILGISPPSQQISSALSPKKYPEDIHNEKQI